MRHVFFYTRLYVNLRGENTLKNHPKTNIHNFYIQMSESRDKILLEFNRHQLLNLYASLFYSFIYKNYQYLFLGVIFRVVFHPL